MTAYANWAARWPQAAAELLQQLTEAATYTSDTESDGKSEAWAQQQVRFKAAQQGARAWRNNVGAMPSKCAECGAKLPYFRWGLCNDTKDLNREVKSSDIIMAIPRLVEPRHVGLTIAQFGSVEVKRPGWHYTDTEEEKGQAAWLSLIASMGGFATFSTGELEL